MPNHSGRKECAENQVQEVESYHDRRAKHDIEKEHPVESSPEFGDGAPALVSSESQSEQPWNENAKAEQ